jgi:hypothetical protein
MPTISQLPTADAVSASDLVPISQDGSVHAVSVGALLAQTQPAIIVAPPSLLGRTSLGPGGPDTIAVGDGLALNNGTLSASAFDMAALPLQTVLSPTDQIIVSSTEGSQRIEVGQIREIFTAGQNITIDAEGVISAPFAGGAALGNLASLSSVSTLTSQDLVGVSHNGQDHTITYANLLDGVTIDAAQPADLASDSDTFWVAQSGSAMVRQTLGALWPWMAGKLPVWKPPIIELNDNTALDESLHNNAILVCGKPITISAATTNTGSGFCCDLINAGFGNVTLSSNILTSNGSSVLSPYQCACIRGFTYSGGAMIIASIGAGTAATAAPGQVTNLSASSLTATGLSLSWSAPPSGGAVSVYAAQYRVTGTIPWLSAGQTNGFTGIIISGLQAALSYDFTVIGTNNVGAGPVSAILTVATIPSDLVPSAPTALVVTNVTANSLTWSWTAPTSGGPVITYAVQYRTSGQTKWNSATSNLSTTTFEMTGLLPGTAYDVQITPVNGAGSGPASALATAPTSQALGLVTTITWNAVPVGSYTRGVGAIGVNVHVNPADAAVQFGFSTSAAVPPTTWLAGVHVNSDFWGQYLPTPTTAGTWFAWVEGADGSAPTVYPTSFTVT